MALVTGASVGIGAAVARDLVQHGMKVIGCARNVQKVQVCSGVISSNSNSQISFCYIL